MILYTTAATDVRNSSIFWLVVVPFAPTLDVLGSLVDVVRQLATCSILTLIGRICPLFQCHREYTKKKKKTLIL